MPEELTRTTLGPFRSGMNTKPAEANLPPGSIARMENFNVWDTPGALATRVGTFLIGPQHAAVGVFVSGAGPFGSSDAAQPIKAMGIWEGRRPSTGGFDRHILTVSRTHLRVIRESDGELLFDEDTGDPNDPANPADLTPTRKTVFTQALTRTYFVTSSTSTSPHLRYWDGDDVTRAGFPAPTVAVSGAANGAGNLSGDYMYKVKFLYGSLAAESSSSPVMAFSITAAAQSIDISLPLGVIGGEFAAVSGREIYRTLPGDFSRYYFVGVQNDNIATTFNDNIPDDDIGPELAPDQNGLPPVLCDAILFHKERMFMARGRDLFFSAAAGHELAPIVDPGIHGAHPEIFPDTFRIPVGDQTQPIVALSTLHDRVIIFKRTEIWQLVGNGPEDYILDLVEPRVGADAPASIVSLPDRIFFLGREDQARFYEFDGVRATPISLPVDRTLVDEISADEVLELNNDAGDMVPITTFAVGGAHNMSYIVSLPSISGTMLSGMGAPTSWIQMAYHWPSASWTIYSGLPVSAMCFQRKFQGGGNLYMGSALGLFVLWFGGQTSDTTDGDFVNIGGGERDFQNPNTHQIAATVRFAPIRQSEHVQYKSPVWISVVSNRPTPAANITVRRRYDLQDEASIPAERTGTISTDDPQTQDPSSRMSWRRIDCRGGGYSGQSSGQLIADVGYLFQPIVDADAPVELYEIGISYGEQEIR